MSSIAMNKTLANGLLDVPLHLIVALERAELTRYVLDRDYAIDTADPKTGRTALHMAVDQVDLENVKLLVARGANVNLRDLNGRIAMLRFPLIHNSSPQQASILKILMDAGAELTSSDSSGKMQISWVMTHGDRQLVRIVLQSDVDMFARDRRGHTLLHYLTRNVNPGVVEEIENKQFAVNLRENGENYTPLHSAIMSCNSSMVRLLLEKGYNTRNWSAITSSVLSVLSSSDLDEFEFANVMELLLHGGADNHTHRFLSQTVLNIVLIQKNFGAAEPVLAYTALSQALGKTITEHVFNRIDQSKRLSGSFELCRKQLDEMKTITVYRKLTLYRLLTESDEKIAIYARDKAFVTKLRDVDDLDRWHQFYFNMLQKRFTTIFEIDDLRRTAALQISNVIGHCYHSNYLISNEIVGHFSDDELRKLFFNETAQL